jgi:hypothetical protein
MDPMLHIPDAVDTLKRELRQIFGARLQSLVAYGLHTNEAAGAHDRGAHAGAHAHERTLTQTMAVVDTVAHDDLRACAERVASWHDVGLATPLLVAAHEFARSLDAFPLEFDAILADHVVVSGESPFNALKVDAADIRRACEVQARSHLLHLREGYLETRGRDDALAVLITRSAAPFAALLKSVARLQGLPTHDAAAAARHAERTLDVPGGIVTDVVKLANVGEISSAEATRLFPTYLDAVERLAKYVDGWSVA